MGLIKISVILPTHSRPEQLKDCLRSLLKQEYPPSHFEVIVVDDSGTHYARHLLREFRELSLRYIPHDRNKGVAAARNTGIQNARYPYVALLEDDLVLPPEYLLTIHNYFRLPRLSVLRFRVNPVRRSFWARVNQNYISDAAKTHERYELSDLPVLTACALPIELVHKAGLLNEGFLRCSDTEYALRLRKHGISIHVYTGLTVQHAHRTRFLESLRQKYAWGTHIPKLHRMYPEYVHPQPRAYLYYVKRLFTASADQMLHEKNFIRAFLSLPSLFLLNAAWTLGVFRGTQ